MSSLKIEVSKWSREIIASMIRLENVEREKEGVVALSSDPLVGMPTKQDDLLALMNLKVWTLRYKVSLDFVLEAVFFKWKFRRKRRKGDTISFGLDAKMVTGVETRIFVEECVLRTYPNGENLRKMPPSFIMEVPDGPLKVDDAFLERYGKEMLRRQAELARPKPNGERNYRR